VKKPDTIRTAAVVIILAAAAVLLLSNGDALAQIPRIAAPAQFPIGRSPNALPDEDFNSDGLLGCSLG
jgi:hypothetical protein